MIKHRFPFAKSLITIASAVSMSVAIAQTDALTREEKEFLKNASELNLTEVELGRLAQERAGTPEIRAIGSRVAADHGKAQSELQALAQRKGLGVKLEPNAGQRQMLNAFAGKSGAEFDKEFREHEIKDHERAIRSFTDAARDSRDPDVKAYAERQLPTLQQHLAMVSGQGPSMKTTETRTERRRELERGEPGRATVRTEERRTRQGEAAAPQEKGRVRVE